MSKPIKQQNTIQSQSKTIKKKNKLPGNGWHQKP